MNCGWILQHVFPLSSLEWNRRKGGWMWNSTLLLVYHLGSFGILGGNSPWHLPDQDWTVGTLRFHKQKKRKVVILLWRNNVDTLWKSPFDHVGILINPTFHILFTIYIYIYICLPFNKWFDPYFIQRLGCTFSAQDEFRLDTWHHLCGICMHLWVQAAHPMTRWLWACGNFKWENGD